MRPPPIWDALRCLLGRLTPACGHSLTTGKHPTRGRHQFHPPRSVIADGSSTGA